MKYRRGTVGWILLVLLLPAIFIDESDQVWFKNVIFNLLGPVNVALAIVYFKNQIVSEEELKSLLKLLALPAISVLTFVVIKTPILRMLNSDLEQISRRQAGLAQIRFQRYWVLAHFWHICFGDTIGRYQVLDGLISDC